MTIDVDAVYEDGVLKPERPLALKDNAKVHGRSRPSPLKAQVIFVDTSFFVALLDPLDKNRARAKGAFEYFVGRRLSDQLLTTNNVVLETITVARYEAGHRLAVRAGEMLYGGKLARLHRTTAEEEAAAFEYLKKYADKEYSAVDCLSFVVMEKLGIREALAFDSDLAIRYAPWAP